MERKPRLEGGGVNSELLQDRPYLAGGKFALNRSSLQSYRDQIVRSIPSFRIYCKFYIIFCNIYEALE